MKPTPFEWLLASRYTLPLWIGLGLYWYSQYGYRWESLTREQDIVFSACGLVFALAYLKSFPTVFFYEREQARYHNSTISPEERWQRATVKQTFFLVLLAAALLYAGFHYWKSSPEPQPVSTPAVLGMSSATMLAGTVAYRTVKSWRSRTPETKQPAIVSWCLPVPKQTTIQVIQLPDYCQLVMTRAQKPTVSQA